MQAIEVTRCLREAAGQLAELVDVLLAPPSQLSVDGWLDLDGVLVASELGRWWY